MAVMEEEAKELLSYFNHRNVDALLRLTRNTLEMLRRRINAPSAMHFAGEKLQPKFFGKPTQTPLLFLSGRVIIHSGVTRYKKLRQNDNNSNWN